MSNLQISIIAGLALWVLFVLLACLVLGANRRQPDQDDKSVQEIIDATAPAPLSAEVAAIPRNRVRAVS